MKKLRFALLLGVVCAAALSVAVSAHGIRSYERELLEHELTRCYPEANLAERTGICAVVLHRLDDPRYPDNVGGVIQSLRAVGEFSSREKYDSSSLRLSRDAVSAALIGADPSGGAVSFRYTKPKLRGFGESDDTGYSHDSVVIGNTEFFK